MNNGGDMRDELEVLHFESQTQWRAWLGENFAAAPGLWMRFAKKGSGISSVTYAEALDVALCFGWIDGQVNKLDDQFYLQRFTPRRPRSRWSLINVGHVERLTTSGEMQAPGLAEVERAKADGRWDAAYASPRNITVPEDLKSALEGVAGAAEFFATLKSSHRYSIIYSIEEAKRSETRTRRIEKFVDMCARNETPN